MGSKAEPGGGEGVWGRSRHRLCRKTARYQICTLFATFETHPAPLKISDFCPFGHQSPAKKASKHGIEKTLAKSNPAIRERAIKVLKKQPQNRSNIGQKLSLEPAGGLRHAFGRPRGGWERERPTKPPKTYPKTIPKCFKSTPTGTKVS